MAGRSTTIYRVTDYDYMVRHYHFATKRAALKRIREIKSKDDYDSSINEPEIDEISVRLNANGIAEALDDFIELTCGNEG